MYDAIVVGAGISGSCLARLLVDELNFRVLLIDRRHHIAGNMYDYFDEYKVNVHQYGPHIFHTNSQKVYDFIHRFGKWVDYKLSYLVEIDGKLTTMPFNFDTIDSFYKESVAAELKRRLAGEFEGKKTATVLQIINSKDPLIQEYGKFLFEKDYKLYTAKQWGIPVDKIDPSIFKRVPIKLSYETGYFGDRYECMPAHGYSAFIKQMVDHPLIDLRLDTDFLDHISFLRDQVTFENEKCWVFYTGPLDELFGHKFGELPYRSLRFEYMHVNQESFQQAAVIAYPQADGFTRITEYKKMMFTPTIGTTYAVEYPLAYKYNSGLEPYYPVLTEQSKQMFDKYRILASKYSNLISFGRLADFKYYNMDQALERAFDVFNDFIKKVQ